MFGGDFIAKRLLSHGDLTCSHGLGRFCDGIRPVESESELKLGLFSTVIKAHHGLVQADCCN